MPEVMAVVVESINEVAFSSKILSAFATAL